MIEAFLTCDIDWAPEFAIEDTLELCSSLGLRPTLFATHDSKAVKGSGLEVGIHPYISRRTEMAYREEIRRLKDIYPEAVGSRTHRNYFGYYIPHMLAEEGLEYDISVVTWLHPCVANRHFTGVTTMTYSWEDGLHYEYGYHACSMPFLDCAEGQWVFNIHPIMVYLNAGYSEHRTEAVRGIRDLARCSMGDLEPYRYRGAGIRETLAVLAQSYKFGNLDRIWRI